MFNKKLMASLMCIMAVLFVSVFVGNSVSAADKTTLTVWDISTQSEALSPAVKDAIDRFEADHPNVTVKHVATANDDYKTKIRIAMAANNEPDIFMTWGSASLNVYVKDGKVYDLTNELNKGWKDNFGPNTLGLATFNGKTYGIPVQGITPALVWYNKDIFNKYDIKVPENWDELLTAVKTLRDKGIIPFALANKTKWTGMEYYMYLVDRMGGADAFRKALNRTGAFNDPAFVKAGQKLQQLVDLGAFPDGVNGLDEDSGQSRMLLYTGKAAMYLIGTWSYGIMQKENPAILDKLGLINFPAINEGKGDPSNLIGAPAQNFYSVSNSSKHKKLAVEFLEYLSDKTMGEKVLATGNIPVQAGMGDEIKDPVLKRIYNLGMKANHVQMWYDQALPLDVASVVLNTTQSLFGKSITPKEAADKIEAAAQKYYSNNQ